MSPFEITSNLSARTVRTTPIVILIAMTLSQQVSAPAAFGEVEFDWVTVGFPGEGDVDYEFQISVYEVTNEQYTAFLNSVASDDTHGLFDERMETDPRGGILRHGTAGMYTYSVKSTMANRPVIYVRFFDAERFVNWLQNGQPTGTEAEFSTEYGTYSMIDLGVHPRQPGAAFFLPSSDEWLKAALFDPRTEAEGGPPGILHRWNYATQSNSALVAAIVDADGNVINPGQNVVNYDPDAPSYDVFGNTGPHPELAGALSVVGGCGSTSYFGTYDQNGNVDELLESQLPPFPELPPPGRAIFAGSWRQHAATYLFLGSNLWGSFRADDVGFRVAAPGCLDTIWNHGNCHCNRGDMNDDGLVDAGDILQFTQVLIDPAGLAAHQHCAADINGDLVVNGLDVQAMMSLLLD